MPRVGQWRAVAALPVPGEDPRRYPASRRSGVRSPPMASRPERSARSGGGKASGSCPRRNTVTGVTGASLVASQQRRAPFVEAPEPEPRHPRADARPRGALARVCPPRSGEGAGRRRRSTAGLPGSVKPLAFARARSRDSAEHASPWCEWTGGGCSTASPLRPLFFRDARPEQRIETLIHELYHVSRASMARSIRGAATPASARASPGRSVRWCAATCGSVRPRSSLPSPITARSVSSPGWSDRRPPRPRPLAAGLHRGAPVHRHRPDADPAEAPGASCRGERLPGARD
jgi:hypothetical protein